MTHLPVTLDFEGQSLTIIDHQGRPWLSAADLARALGYAQPKAIHRLYTMHSAEFTAEMSEVIESMTSGNLRKKTRIFSPRGAHAMGFFARTPKAAQFRRWVLDVLEDYERNPTPTITHRRWILSYDHRGQECVQAVPDDACVMTHAQMLQAMVEPNGLNVPTPELAEFAIAAIRRIAHREEYWKKRAKEASASTAPRIGSLLSRRKWTGKGGAHGA